MRHYAKSEKFAGSIPDQVTGFFSRPNPSSCTLVLGVDSASNRNEYQESESKGWPARKANNLIAICEPIVHKMWDPRRLKTLWAPTAFYRDSFSLFPYQIGVCMMCRERLLEHFQSKALRMIVDAPWYVPNTVIGWDFQTPNRKSWH
jgi:hypothetical protein